MGWDADKNILTRRGFLRWTAAASALAVQWSMPTSLFAADDGGLIVPRPERKPQAPRLLMIDPGHGGHDPGAIGRVGTYEKEVTLDIVRRMADALSGIPGITCKVTRDDDTFIPLEERVKIGREAGADMFLSIHADSAPNPAASGLSVYTLSEHASDNFSKALAEKENEADMMGGVDLPPADKETTAILFDLTARQTRNTAMHAKANFVAAMSKNWHLLESPMRAANFVVLRAPDIPSMLIETGFLSNPHDEAILRQPQEREKIARLMARDLGNILESSLFG